MPLTIQTAPSNEQLMTENYVAILEKTNQQLGLWSNPYGVMIGILGLMFAFAAIAVTIYIWWTSSEQKKERKIQEANFFSNFEKIANKNIEEFRKNIEESRKQYDELISAQEKTLTTSKKNTRESEKVLMELKRERANIGTTLGGTTVWGPTVTASSGGVYPISASTLSSTGPLYATTAYGATGTVYTGYGSGGTIFTGNSTSSSLNRFCSICITPYSYDQKFCAKCGHKLTS